MNTIIEFGNYKLSNRLKNDLTRLASDHPLKLSDGLNLKLESKKIAQSTKIWCELCIRYQIQDSAGGVKLSPKGLRNRIVKRFVDKRKKSENKIITQPDVIRTLSYEEFESEFEEKPLEKELLTLYWGVFLKHLTLGEVILSKSLHF
ncbi:hypothetical protein ACLKMH_17600 [Psychromonas sp. KJ10-10]|uniref:hypothetical protein n=1 Tax=Psychromonas sp. KJ10-10 TaxID=3391823 RepID=UPI0039B64EB6